MRTSSCFKRYQHGLSLIEVLVTIVILALGLLGVAGLHANALKSTQSALYRGIAAQLAYDMADRMRANPAAARAGDYNLAIGTAAPAGSTLAQTDLQSWRTRLANSLPGGTGGIATNGDAVTVTVQWNDARATVDVAALQTAAATANFAVTARVWSN